MKVIKIRANRIKQSSTIGGMPDRIVPETEIDYDRAINVECDTEYFYVYYKDKISFLAKIKEIIKKLWV